MKRPIFIVGAHKSGTSLLRSIFDSHEELFTVPIGAHFFKLLGSWIEYFYRRQLPHHHSRDNFIDSANKLIERTNKSNNHLGGHVVNGLLDLNSFESYLDLHLKSDIKSIEDMAHYYEVYIRAIHLSLYGDELDQSKRIVEKCVENAEFAFDLKSMFPEAAFVHIVRNPYANMVSIRKYKSIMKGGSYPWVGVAYRTLRHSYYFLYRNRQIIRNYTVVRYEDLVAKPQETIKLLCEATGVRFMESMLTPTFLGQPWLGNSTTLTTFDHISASRVDGWQEQITPLEAGLINQHLRHVVDEFDYQYYEMGKSVFWPVRKESLMNYIKNRSLWLIG